MTQYPNTNQSVYMLLADGAYALLYASTEEKVNEFMRFWAQYRPLSQIQIRYLNTMDGVTVSYQGEAFNYPLPKAKANQ